MGSTAAWRNVAGFLPALLWALLVIFLSLTSVTMLPEMGWTAIAGIDKLGHLVFYCILALWLYYGFFQMKNRFGWISILVIAVSTVFGAGLELMQAMMRGGRQFEYLDIAANTAGILIAYCIFNVFLKNKYHGS